MKASPIATILPTSVPDFDTEAKIVGGILAGGVAVMFWGFVFWLVALIDILKSEFKDSNNKIIWLVLTLILPFLGPLLYFVVGRKQATKGTGINLRNTLTILSFFIWYPLGIILMWILTKWQLWVKILITIVGVGLFLLTGFASKFM